MISFSDHIGSDFTFTFLYSASVYVVLLVSCYLYNLHDDVISVSWSRLLFSLCRARRSDAMRAHEDACAHRAQHTESARREILLLRNKDKNTHNVF